MTRAEIILFLQGLDTAVTRDTTSVLISLSFARRELKMLNLCDLGLKVYKIEEALQELRYPDPVQWGDDAIDNVCRNAVECVDLVACLGESEVKQDYLLYLAASPMMMWVLLDKGSPFLAGKPGILETVQWLKNLNFLTEGGDAGKSEMGE